MTILNLPFVYTVSARRDRRYKFRKMFALDHVTVDVPDVAELPEPAYTVAKPGYETLHWRFFGPVLMRPVVRFDRLATLTEVENEHELLSPPIDLDWFSDHPSARLVPRREPFEPNEHIAFPNIERMQIESSDRHVQENASLRRYADCVVCNGHLYVPSRPPTWAVIVGEQVVSLTCDIGDRKIPPFPTFHFGAELTDAVESFVETAVGGHRDLARENSECSYALSAGRLEDGAISTVRCLTHILFPRFANWHFADLPPAFARILAALRIAYDSDNDTTANQFLAELDQTAGDLPPTPFDQMVELLHRRNELVHQANFDHHLKDVRL